MPNVLLGVTGSVAAIRTPELYQALCAAGHSVKVVATGAALYFFDPARLGGTAKGRDASIVILDEDEWPGRGKGMLYSRDDPVLHIELRRWADALLIAPLDANTLAKMANGMADNCLTCVWRAWDPTRPIVLAPAMNTLMWEHPSTRRHLLQLGEDCGSGPNSKSDHDEVIAFINERCRALRIVPPLSKRLACGDIGMGGIADVNDMIICLNEIFPEAKLSTRPKFIAGQ
jgi:phosphopantothenoylcysteine decarboxylase